MRLRQNFKEMWSKYLMKVNWQKDLTIKHV